MMKGVVVARTLAFVALKIESEDALEPGIIAMPKVVHCNCEKEQKNLDTMMKHLQENFDGKSRIMIFPIEDVESCK